ncbi:MAG: hypothetical protein OMM_01318 [Candidatus Magnetoglobus multicellularis str. Araruama]|uniref:LamG-like jellyroll fold domain-containing protein n=1 Tax=Candidatus Magnetoglobus multicellularis str. Araruama TaxID=890399 RepID=A0A1V1PDS1_9BACT|nr:MAG: hypothetical protein OMM_01318 [Candidatus Magnetoglobus multicellularis str. Araruama]
MSENNIRLIDSNIKLYDKDSNPIIIGDITSINNIVIPFDAEIEFQIEVIEGALNLIVKSDYQILKVPVPGFAEISVTNGQLNLWGSAFNKSFPLNDNEDVLIVSEETAIIRISETWERKDLGSYSMAKLAGANCARFISPVSLGVTLGEIGLVYEKDWSICFYVKDNRTNWTPNMLINAGAFFVFIDPQDTGGRLIVGTTETTTGTYACKTEQEFLEGVFVLNYYAEGKRMMIYFNGDLLYDEAKESVTAWDTTKEVFLSKYRNLITWDFDPDFNMAGLGFYNRVLSEEDIIFYCCGNVPSKPVLFLPFSEGGSSVLHSMNVKETYHLYNSNCATFGGGNDYVDTGKNINDLSINYGSAHSVSFNFNASALDGFFFGALNVSGQVKDYAIYVTATGEMSWEFYENTSEFVIFRTAAETISTSTDYNIVITCDGNFDLAGTKLYINGTETSWSNSGNAVNGVTALTENLHVGRRNYAAAPNCFNGLLTNFTIHSKVLSASEISTINNGGFVSDSLTLSYPFAEGAGAVAYDVSGNDNHGTITNANLSTFWGARQDNFHYNLLKGHSKLMYFDDDYINTNQTCATLGIDYNMSFTIAFDVSFASIETMYIFGSQAGSPTYNQGILIYMDADGKISFSSNNHIQKAKEFVGGQVFS